jgi:4-hydroxy-3-methylbut-2-enyl diphosphate reductase
MKIIRAQHLGMCFGVRDAIALALKQADATPVTILGDLVHNQSVLDSLREKGIRIENRIESVSTPTVMITAHGASEQTLNRVRGRGLNVVEATCPLVAFAHRAVAKLIAEGYHPVIIGQRDHVEVRGLTEDLEQFDVVLSEADVAGLQERPRFGVAAQTTQPIDRVRHLVSLIRRRFRGSEVRFLDTVCQPTKQRQSAAIDLASQCDVVMVIGGANSNNTRELVATCRRYCPRVHHVQSAADLRPEWFAGAETVGITAGTSTPDRVIDAIEARLRELAASRDILAGAQQSPRWSDSGFAGQEPQPRSVDLGSAVDLSLVPRTAQK